MINFIFNKYNIATIAARILQFHGAKIQKVVCMEELSELIQALAKDVRADDPAADVGHNEARCDIVNEYADCLIMLAQMEITYSITMAEALDVIGEKLKREIDRIGKAEEWKKQH